MKKKKSFFPNKKYFFLAGILLIFDIITKYLFQNQITPLFNNSFFTILFSKNYGSSFSLFSNIQYYSIFIIVISIAIIMYMINHIKTNWYSFSKIKQMGFMLFITGIFGNLFDRIVFGYVRDFLFLKGFFIFNFADVYLSLGVLFIFISEIKSQKDIKKKGE